MEPDMPYLSGKSLTTLKGFFFGVSLTLLSIDLCNIIFKNESLFQNLHAELSSTLKYFFSRKGSHILDYELGLQRSIKRGTSEFFL